jgi:hypothetical protein
VTIHCRQGEKVSTEGLEPPMQLSPRTVRSRGPYPFDDVEKKVPRVGLEPTRVISRQIYSLLSSPLDLPWHRRGARGGCSPSRRFPAIDHSHAAHPAVIALVLKEHVAGFEPAVSSLATRRSSPLCYTCTRRA